MASVMSEPGPCVAARAASMFVFRLGRLLFVRLPLQLWRLLQIRALSWAIDANEKWCKACERDGIASSRSLAEVRRQTCAYRVRLIELRALWGDE